MRLLAFSKLNVPERRTYAGKQFARAERLCNVIVRARFQRFHLVPLPCACGNHYYGHIRPSAHVFYYPLSVHVRQPKVKQHQIRTMRRYKYYRLRPVARNHCIEPVGLKHRAHKA